MSNYKPIDFKAVDYVGWANDRLILRSKYIIDGREFSDIVSIYNGKLKSYDVCYLTKAILKGDISETDFERVRNLIMDGINKWCRNLGLLEVTQKI